jgi:hypothetical protein
LFRVFFAWSQFIGKTPRLGKGNIRRIYEGEKLKRDEKSGEKAKENG